MKLRDVKPVKLKHECPVDISEICNTLKRIIIIMRGIDIENQKNDTVRNKLMKVRPMVDKIMNMLISVVGEEKEERWTNTFFERLKREINAYLSFLDDVEGDLLSGTTATTGDLEIYQARLITGIESMIYAPIHRANLRESDPDRWTACLWNEIKKKVGTMAKKYRKMEEREEEPREYEELIGKEEGKEKEALKEAMEKKEKAEGLLKDLEGKIE